MRAWDLWCWCAKKKCFVTRWNSDPALSLILEPEMGIGVEIRKRTISPSTCERRKCRMRKGQEEKETQK